MPQRGQANPSEEQGTGFAAWEPVDAPELPVAWTDTGVWSAMFDAAPAPHALFHLRTRRLLANRRCAELFGYAHLQGRWADVSEGFTLPEDADDREGGIRRARAGELEGVQFDRRFVRADRSVFTGHVEGTVLRDEEGSPWAVLVSITDVSAQVAAEAALDETRWRFAALVEHSYDPIIVVDAEGTLQYASPAADRVFGGPAEALVGSDMFSLLHPDDVDRAVAAFVAILAEPGVGRPARLRMVRPDGSVRHLELLPTNRLDDPAVGGIVINVHDLTEAEHASSALEMTENRMRRMLENISDTITLVRADGRIAYSTGQLRTLLTPNPPSADRNAFDLLHPADRGPVAKNFASLIREPGRMMRGEARARLADGSGYIDVELSAVNLLEDPDVSAVVLTSRDITERRRVERELAEARDQAVRALQNRTEFIANVSHELRTPIHGILGLSELLAHADLDDDARSLARSIGRATDSLRMVLDDILDFAKIEVGRLDVNDAPLDVGEMEADIKALFQPQARAKGIDLTAEIEPGFPEVVLGDALRVRQVLHNLVGNAIKFTSEGGVHVSLRRAGPAPGDDRPRLWLAVSDTGIGIPADAHGRLFEPFSQVHGETNRELGGTGLGLSIAKRLVELMGGDLGFRSEPGRGSEFWFTLPLVEVAAGRSAVDDRPRHEDTITGGRVLVVEDNPINQLLVRRQLERLGYDSIVVETGIAALETMPYEHFDLVLMDWQLPGIDGLETTRRLRSWETAAGRAPTPVVAMTASALPGDRDRCIAAGMDDFVAKPVGIATLAATVRRWIPADLAAPATPGAEPTGGTGPLATGAIGAAPGGTPDTAIALTDPGAAIEADVLDQLAYELADPALVATVVRTYRRELAGRLAAVSAAVDDEDAKALERSVHTLRSTSVAVGAVRLAAACEQLERGARAAPERMDTLGLGEALAGLRREADEVDQALDIHARRLDAMRSTPSTP